MKKQNPFIEKMEEKTGKDLDNDGEKGEAKAHKQKVLGASKKAPAMKRVGGNDTMPKAKPKVPPMKGGKKMCGPCMSAKKSSCSHQ